MIKSLYEPYRHWSENGSVYILSDTHFSDSDCNLMDPEWIKPDEQVRKINELVHKCDTLVLLGDVGNIEYARKLNGHKVLLLGNHDRGAEYYRRKGEGKKDNHLFDEVYAGPLFIAPKIMLSHEPVCVGLKALPSTGYCLNIHGHDHNGSFHPDDYHLNVAANVVKYVPVNLGAIIKDGFLKDIEDIHQSTINNARKKAETEKHAEKGEKMERKEFVEEIIENLKGREKFKEAVFEERFVTKTNTSYNGLVIKRCETSPVSPTFNADDLYSACLNGASIEEICDHIDETIIFEPGGLNYEMFKKYEVAKPHLFVRINYLKNNEGILDKAPHKVMCDMVLTCHLIVLNGSTGLGTTLVSNSMLETYGITEEQLWEDAFANSEKINQPCCDSLMHMAMSMMDSGNASGFPVDDVLDYINDLVSEGMVLTNTSKVNGASVIMYPGLLHKIAEKIGNFVIIPSSIHEVIVYPLGNGVDINDFLGMLHSVNETEVAIEERLSDSILIYTQEDDQLHAYTGEDNVAG